MFLIMAISWLRIALVYSIAYHLKHVSSDHEILDASFFYVSSFSFLTHISYHRSLVSSKVGQLGGDNKTSNTGRGEGGQNTRDKGRDGKTRNVTTSRGGKLAENTNLDTQGSNVAETAESVGGDELGAGGEAVVWGGGVGGGEVSEGVVLVLGGVSIYMVIERRELTVMIFWAMRRATGRISPVELDPLVRETPRRKEMGKRRYPRISWRVRSYSPRRLM